MKKMKFTLLKAFSSMILYSKTSASENNIPNLTRYRCLLLFSSVLFKFNYWSKFNVNIMTGSGVVSIFVYKGMTRNPGIGNTTIRVLSNIWRLGRVRYTKFGTSVSNKKLLNAAKSVTVSDLLKKNQQGGVGERWAKITHPSRLTLSLFASVLQIFNIAFFHQD